jgi:hypothetical protein
MTNCNNHLFSLRKSRNLLVALSILITLSANSVYAQTFVSLPLNNYSNNGIQTLTPSITANIIQGQDPDVAILMDGSPLPDWLDTNCVALNASTYQINLKVKKDRCVPIPSGQLDCTPACGNSVTGYSQAAVRACHTLSVTAYGFTQTAYLCVFGDPVLSITTPANQGFDQQVGDMVEKIWTANRTSNLKWTLSPITGVNSAFLKIAPGSEVSGNAKLDYKPLEAETGSYNLKVSGGNPNITSIDVCDPPQTAVVTVKASIPSNEGKKVDLVLVLDISGSMGEQGACTKEQAGTQYNPADFTSKMGFMKSNLKGIFKKIVDVQPAPGSRIAVVTFTTNSEKKIINGKFFNDISDAATQSGINSIIEGLTPLNTTNMGAGLNDAIQELENNSAAPKKQIVLITNGMQNENPMVRIQGSTNYIDFNNNEKYDGGEEIPADIQIFTIAIFQPSNDYLNLLKSISGDGARFDDVCALNEAVDEAFANTYSNNSPKMVGSRSGNFTGNTTTINYSLMESEFDKILVSVSSTRNTNLSFTFEKNVGGTWKDITSGGTIDQVMPNYAIYSIAGLPKMVNGVNITPQGEYRLVANSTVPDADYYSSAIEDNRGLKAATFVQSKTIRAGDTVGLSTSIRYSTDPVHQSNATVKAVIHRPVASFEKLMAKEKVPGNKVVKSPFDREKQKSSIFKKLSLKPADGCTFEATLPLIEQKYQILVYQKGFLGKLVFETDTVPLPEITNGVYQADYSNTKVSGLYNVEYLVNGELPVSGKFFRTQSHSTPVLFGIPDRSKSNFYLFDEGGSYFLSLKPVDIYGNYLGMGKAEQISMTMTIGSHTYPLDYLDGHYIIPLNVPGNDNPYVVITVAGMDFYRGLLFNIPEKKFFVGLGAGFASPLGKFNTTANPGYLVGLKFGYRFTRKLGILAEGGYFSFKDTTNANSVIIGGGAGLFYIPTSLPVSNGINLQLEGTVGYYKPDGIDGAWGLRGGLDLGKFFRTWFSMSLNASYYQIYTKPDPIQFIGISLNAKIHF